MISIRYNIDICVKHLETIAPMDTIQNNWPTDEQIRLKYNLKVYDTTVDRALQSKRSVRRF